MIKTAEQRIYLAGKISNSDWRHSLVRGLRCARTESEIYEDWPEITVGGTDLNPTPWTYTGPYFISDDHGCGHGPRWHGNGNAEEDGICGGAYPQPARSWIVRQALAAIDRSDVVFAWLGIGDAEEQSSAYGTLAELGYASGKGKEIIVAAPCVTPVCDCALDELWFAARLPGVRVIHGHDPVRAFNRWYRDPSLVREIEISWEYALRD
jgi:hypothetical protein